MGIGLISDLPQFRCRIKWGASGTAEGRESCARAAVPAFGHERRSKPLRQNMCSMDGDPLHRKCLKLHVLVGSALAR